MAKSRGSRDAIPMPALLRHARAAYALAIGTALTEAGYDDIPKNGLYVIGGLALQAGNYPLGQLIENLRLSKQAAGYLVDMLVRRGYLDREVHGEDRRKLTIDLTERGKGAAKTLIAASAAVDAELLSRVGSKDVEGTHRALLALVDIGRRLAAEAVVSWK